MELNQGEKSTVGDLIEALEKLDPNMQVGMSSDEEGNSYSKFIYPEVTNNLVILYPSGSLEIDEFDDYEEDEE